MVKSDLELKKNIQYYSQFFDTMIWADIDGSDDIENDYDVWDIDKLTLTRLIEDLDYFFEQAEDILEASDYDHDKACHDFYLTRQGHGAGFWEADHCTKEQGEKLTEIAESLGSLCIIEDNGYLYIE